jgi:hypothetical protein
MKMNRRVAALTGVVALALTAAVVATPLSASAANITVHAWLSPATGTLDGTAPEVLTDGECPLVSGVAAQSLRVTVKGGTGTGAITAINGKSYVGAKTLDVVTVGTTGSITGYIIPSQAGSWNDWFQNYAQLGVGPMLGTYAVSVVCQYSASTSTFDTTMTVDASGNYTSLAVGTQPPAVQNTAKPVITGSATVGGTLNASTGTWDQAGSTFAYQWNLDGAPIGGATANTYSPVAGDLGKAVTVTVTASKASFNDGSATSNPVTVASLGTINNTAKPTITGSGFVGSEVAATPGAWDVAGTTYAYQWNLDGNAIMGANTNVYTPVAGDSGHNLTVTVTASKATYADASATSDPLAVVSLQTFKATKVPTVVGNAAVGATLTAGNPTWSISGVSVSFQWLRGGVTINNAKSKSYKLTAADKGKSIAVRVTGSASGYNNATTTSAAIIWNNVLPKVTGKAKVGQTLKSSTGTWSTSGVKATYQWTRNGAVIKGATKSSYKLTKTDKGKKVGVKVTVSKSGYRTATAISAAVKVS